MLRSGDVVEVDLETPIGSEAGFRRPAVVTTCNDVMMCRPTTIFVVPLTTTGRTFPSHLTIEADTTNGLETTSYAQVEQMRAVSTQRCEPTGGTVGPIVGAQMLDLLAMITGIP